MHLTVGRSRQVGRAAREALTVLEQDLHAVLTNGSSFAE
jgi:hypothetical protein